MNDEFSFMRGNNFNIIYIINNLENIIILLKNPKQIKKAIFQLKEIIIKLESLKNNINDNNIKLGKLIYNIDNNINNNNSNVQQLNKNEINRIKNYYFGKYEGELKDGKKESKRTMYWIDGNINNIKNDGHN